MKVTIPHSLQRFNSARVITHFIVIVMIFVLPELVMTAANPRGASTGWANWMYVHSAIYIAVFYTEYSLIIGHTLTGKHRSVGRFVMWNIVLLVGALVLCHLIGSWLLERALENAPKRPHERPTPPEDFGIWRQLARHATFYVRDGAMILLTIGLAVALRLGNRWSQIERRSREIAEQQRATELENLKNQLNPHFLFNTLNSIYALIAISPDTAQDAVHRLAGMMRYVLYDNPKWVELSREIEFVENYVALQRLRMGADGIVLELPDELPLGDVPPMIFISLIENAIKHGNTGSEQQPVSITFSRGDRDGEPTITCTTANHFSPDTRKDRSSGIGVTNLRRRLELIYQGSAHYDISTAGDTYACTLTLPLHVAPSIK